MPFEPPSRTPHVADLSFAVPRRRCGKHAFMRTADGACVRCSREALQSRERRRAVWTSVLCAAALATLAAVLARRATANAEAVAPPVKNQAVAPFDIADEGTARSAKLAENDRVASAIDEANPPAVPMVVTTSLSGITPEERDRALAAREAQRQHVLARRAAAARRVTEERLAEENQVLADFHRREVREAQEARVASSALPTRAPVSPLRVTNGRRCGRRARDPQYEFSF